MAEDPRLYVLKQIISKEYRSDGERYPYLRMDDLRSLIWETQLKTVFPVIERYRSYFIKKYSSYIQKALPPQQSQRAGYHFPGRRGDRNVSLSGREREYHTGRQQ